MTTKPEMSGMKNETIPADIGMTTSGPLSVPMKKLADLGV
ncbi:hypothetical protein FH063_002372 [Azospirillum argentinense]|uniref:Uncharacterized protein n=1 Tax=Azospirillum argentinense TaxID=2970906 RepID=A0A5B0KQC4_9PROT|nr:hypothetical protein FH063_002372 [Azospirillum argentinense]